MRPFLVALCFVAAGSVRAEAAPHRQTALSARDTLAGRWEGSLRLPGEDIRLIIDLDRTRTGGWVGSIILPSLNVKGAPLSDLVFEGSHAHFTVPTVFGGPPDGPATLDAALQGTGALTGMFAQGGNRARFSLHRTGPPQVEVPPASTSIDAPLVGTWKGDYELGGYIRHVTLELANQSDAPATAKFGVVGKQPHALSVSLIREDEGLLRVESPEFGGIAFEGRLQEPDELHGSMEQGAADVPIVLKRLTPGAP